MKGNKWNKFEEKHRNNLLTLNPFFIFLNFFFPSTFPLYFIFFAFALKFSKDQT